jgi:hypothetical protein
MECEDEFEEIGEGGAEGVGGSVAGLRSDVARV